MNTKQRLKTIEEEIQEEMQNQNEKWGEQNHLPIEWISILMEEVGEATKEVVDYHFQNPYKADVGGSLEVSENHIIQHLRLRDYRKEMIQVAAVAIQAIKSLDRSTRDN